MATSNKPAIGRLEMLARSHGLAMRWETYQVDACAEAAFGFMVSYLVTTFTQVPHTNTAILGDTRKILAIRRQGNGPWMNIYQGACRPLISTD